VARPSRKLAALAAAAAAALWDDLDHRTRAFRRMALKQRSTWNVTAETGDPSAPRTLILVAHHDAARTGAIFNPAIPRVFADRFPALYERNSTSPALLRLVLAGPALVAAGALIGRTGPVRTGFGLSLATCAMLAHIGASETVPGANDNLSGVATVLALARRLRERPIEGLRVVLVSAGSEESNSEGFQAWGRRHFAELPREDTTVLCVDTVGSPQLAAPECEGMIVHHDYDAGLKELARDCAERAGIPLKCGLRFSFASDAQIAMHAGYRSMMLGSVDRYRMPANYHWPSDDADNVEYETVGQAVELCEAMARAIAADGVPAT
jgi:hypothetical protein